jgi:hypothetical protein
VQQDAVDFLAQILKETPLKPANHQDLQVIRDDLRNRYVGHPVSNSKGNKIGTKFIVNAVAQINEASFIELGKEGLEIHQFNLINTIDAQRRMLLNFLTNLKSKVMEKEERFREKARTECALDVVKHSTFNYHVGMSDPETDGMKLYHAKEMRKLLGLFKRAFEDVGSLNQQISGELRRMDYVVAEVVAFHEADEIHRRLNSEDIGIFLYFLENSYKQLISHADEIEESISRSVINKTK